MEIKEVDTLANNYRVLKREIALCTNRAGDTLTIARASEACPNDYTATTQLATAFSFSNPSSTIVTCTWSAGVAEDYRINKTNREDIQNQTHVYSADTGTANAYLATLSPAPTAYVAGMALFIKATNANTGTSTINVNGLGVKTIKKIGNATLISGDITAGQVLHLVYDGTDFELQTPTPPVLPVDTYVLGEACAQGDALTLERYMHPLACDSQISFGNASASQYQAFRVVGNGISMSAILAGLKKVGTPADNCILAIQADSSGSPSGTDLATATIAGGTLTTTSAQYSQALSGSITPTDKAWYWVVCRRSGALDASNYYQLAVHTDDTVAFPYKTNNAGAYGSALLTETHSIFGTGFYTDVAVRAKATVWKFARVRLFSPSTLSALATVSKVVSNNYTGVTLSQPGKQMYLSDTAGAISFTAGTVKSPAGIGQNSSTIKIEDSRVPLTLAVTQSGDANTTIYSNPVFIERSGMATIKASGTSGINSGGTGYIEWSTDLVTWTAYEQTSGSAGATWTGTPVCVPMPGGLWFRTRFTITTAQGTATGVYYT